MPIGVWPHIRALIHFNASLPSLSQILPSSMSKCQLLNMAFPRNLVFNIVMSSAHFTSTVNGVMAITLNQSRKTLVAQHFFHPFDVFAFSSI